MSIRDAIARQPAVSIGVSAVVVILGLIFLLRGLFAPPPRAIAIQAYYTTDDGKTFFPDEAGIRAPFDHGGQQAYSAFVYTCDGGTTKFVGYLQRYTSAAHSRLESQAADFNAGKTRAPALAGPTDTEVHKPGTSTWINRADPQAAQIMNVRCATGAPADLLLP